MSRTWVRRKAPGEFPKHTIELLQTFAAQSVLVIQNDADLQGSVGTRRRSLHQRGALLMGSAIAARTITNLLGLILRHGL